MASLPQIELVHRLVVDIGRNCFDSIAVRHAVGLLLVTNEVLVMALVSRTAHSPQPQNFETLYLCACNNSLGLYALDSLEGEASTEVGVDGEALPVATASGDAAQRANDGAEGDVHPFDPELLAHGLGATPGEGLVPAGTDAEATGETADEVGGADALAGIAEAET